MKKLLATLGSLKRRSMQKVAVAGGLFTASVASAITAPAAGSFAYDLYDVGVNDVLLGAPGFVGGVIIMVVAAINLTKNWLMSVAGLLGGVVLMNADTITASMGMLI